MACMNENVVITQANNEAEGWKRILGFLQQENIHQKNKLAEMLKRNNGRNEYLLEVAERYQSQFLQQDEAFRLMWNDLSRLERLIREEMLKNHPHAGEVGYRQMMLRKEIKNLELNFDKLKSDFSRFSKTFA
jgi:hypothetical protein